MTRRLAALLFVVVGALLACPQSPAGPTPTRAPPPRAHAPSRTIAQLPPPPAPCEGTLNLPPDAPSVVSPIAGAIDASPDALVIATQPMTDPDGNAHAATRYELWDGATLVWSLQTDAPALLTTASLADGTFAGVAAGTGSLEGWRDYTLRVRFMDDSGTCASWGPSSPDLVFRTDDGGAVLFDPTVVRTFELTLPQSTIDAINNEAAPPGCVQFQRAAFPGSLKLGDQIFDDVGISNKGGCGSARNLNGKASFKVRLSWDDPAVDGCPATRRLLGQKTLTFNNGVQDGTAVHERLGYELYRAMGVPAPRTTSVTVVVNGELWGLYTLVETIDRHFLDRHFADNDGMMYEGAYWCDLVEGNVPANLDDFSCFEREFSSTGPCDSLHADPTDWELLRTFTQQIAAQCASPSFYPEVESFMDFDEFLSMWAVDATLSHWDAYSFHIMNNYRVYHDPSDGRWRMIPWGIDQTFGTGGDVDPFSSDTVLVNACVNDPECVQAFGARLHEVADLFDQLQLAGRAQELHDALQPFVYADPRKEYGNDAWENASRDLQAWIGQRTAVVRQDLSNRGL